MSEICGQRIETTIMVTQEDQYKGSTLASVALAGVARCRFICQPKSNPTAECPVQASILAESNQVIFACSGLTEDSGCDSYIVGDWGKTESPVTLAAGWIVDRTNDLSSNGGA